MEQTASDKPIVVALGTSAGGLTALKRFFTRVPANSGCAYVVVVHLSPEHTSHLADLLQPHVPFPVEQVQATVKLEPNHVYVIPPGANLEAIDTHLRLTEIERQARARAPIDHFFRTLAATHDGQSIAIILTGTGSDGTLGVKEVKARNGFVIVQDPNEAEFDGMPQSAIATGMVDFVAPVAEIPALVSRICETQPRLPFVDDESAATEQEDRVLLQKVFAQIRARTERDFSRYKRSTILRRIARRMQINHIETLPAYLDRLRENGDEVRALADDLLITVTNFFRDPEVFDRLAQSIIPRLFDGKQGKDVVRAWSVGCATGEEAYSIAMLLLEEASRRESPCDIQVFASDLHRRSLERAREGFFPGDIDQDVSSERLRRFFHKENGGYRIAKEVRDLVVFAPHNLLSDPPFSRLDIICCRNLLIYLERPLQRDVIELFHYALNPEGTLLLGSAETLDSSELFRPEDKRLCIYRKRNVPGPEPRLPVFPLVRRSPAEAPQVAPMRVEPMAHETLHRLLLERCSPASVLVGPDNRLLHLTKNAGRYLVHPGGEVTSSVLKLVRGELSVELRSLLQSSRDSKQDTSSVPIPVRFNGHPEPIVIRVIPAQEAEYEGFALVIFEEQQAGQSFGPMPAGRETDGESSPRVAQLETEVQIAKQRLQTVVEEYETAQEEMKASNEEFQSNNEELRSTLEELETSKEELQSINEELHTVNQENRHKVEELAQLSSDLSNLLAATDIATLFLDRDMRILRFTPKLGELFNVRVTDRGPAYLRPDASSGLWGDARRCRTGAADPGARGSRGLRRKGELVPDPRAPVP